MLCASSTMIIISCPCTISLWSFGHHSLPYTPSSHVLLMPNSKHLTHGISNLVSLITKTKLGLLAPWSGWWCKENTRGFILVRAKKALRPVGETILYFFASKCLCRGYKLQEREAVPSLKREWKRGSVACDRDALREVPSASSFIGSSGGREVQKTLDRCLGGEGLSGTT
jgi:hypothetical protein